MACRVETMQGNGRRKSEQSVGSLHTKNWKFFATLRFETELRCEDIKAIFDFKLPPLYNKNIFWYKHLDRTRTGIRNWAASRRSATNIDV
jgi:hypothetical protein